MAGGFRVMVVDDHAYVREAVVAMVERAPDLVVCAQAASIDEAEREAEHAKPDVVIIDLHLGDASSIAAARRIRSASPGTQTVMLTAASDKDALVASILAGAAAYLPKQLRGTDLVGTVRRVAQGERLLDPVAVAGVLEELGERPAGPAAAASAPGLLTLLAQGRTDDEIRDALGVDGGTVRVRVARLVTGIAGPERPNGHRTARLNGDAPLDGEARLNGDARLNGEGRLNGEAAQPEAAQPEAAQPEAAQPEAASK